MRVWFMVGALILGIIGVWGEQDRTGRSIGGDGTVSTMDDPNPIPTPYDPDGLADDPNPIPTPRARR
jgi:hypothetical protein